MLNLLRLAGTLSDPRLGLSPGLIQSKQAALTTALDELIGLCDKATAIVEQPGVCDFSLVEDSVDVGILREVEGGKSGRRVVRGRGRKRAGLDDRCPGEVVVDDGLAIGFENALGRHFADESLRFFCCGSQFPLVSPRILDTLGLVVWGIGCIFDSWKQAGRKEGHKRSILQKFPSGIFDTGSKARGSGQTNHKTPRG